MSFEKKRNNDNSPLSDLLKNNKLTLAEQLSLTIVWNRADIARKDIFTGQLLPKSILHNAMMESLIHNRVDFVRLLLENGVNMDEFLTIARLEELYNTDQGPPNTLYYIVRDVVKIRAGYRYKLPHIGMAVEKLMANGFRSHYTSSHFRQKYNEYRSKLKEYQRLHSISEQHQKDLNQRSPPPPSYPRCGSEFFARASARGLPTSASDTRLSGKINQQQVNLQQLPKNKNQNVLENRTNQNIGSPPTTDRATNKNTLNYTQIPAVCGSRTLSSHILWRSACRRDNASHLPTAPQQVSNSARNIQKQQPFSRTHQQFNAGFPDGNNSFDADEFLDVRDETHTRDFRYPFSDLLIWAVLTKRHDMAICMWQYGHEALAKALVTCRLYKSLAKEAAEDYLELEVCEELKKCAEEFRQLSLDLLDHCYKEDDAQTLQLLTYELAYWGRETCLSLAVLVNNKQFLAHPCCQILLADLWHGGLRIRSNSNLKVILGIIFPPSIFLLEFKSREELMLQPQTAAEHQEDINDSSSSSSDSSDSSPSSSPSESENEDADSDYDLSEKTGGASLSDRRRRVSSRGSMQSLNFTSIFQSKRRSKRSSHITASNSLNTPDLELGKVANQDEPSVGRSRSNAREMRRPKTKARAERQRRINASSAATVVGGQSTIKAGGDTTPSDYSPSNQISKTPRPLKSSLKPPTSVTPLHIDVNAYHHPQFLLGNDDIVNSGKEEEKDSNSVQRNSTSTISDEVVKLSVDKEQDIPSPHQNPSDRPFIHQTKSFPFNNRWKFVKNIGTGIANNKTKTLEHPTSRLTISGGHVPKGIPLPEGVTLNKKRQIKFRRKVYEFFVAPITTFWAWMLSFVVFLCTLTYVLLIRTPLKPTFLEWYLLAYVVGFGIETVRKFAMSEPKKFSEKVQYFFGNYWNFLTTVAILGFVVGFIFRLNPSTSKNVGRIILAVDSVLWTIKLLDFLGVFPRFGPYITMAGKMIMNMSSIVVMLGISLLGFGLARQSITYPNEDWHWLLLRNVFYKPYFMLYGEVYADEIDTCGDEAWDEHLDKNISIATAWTHRDNRDKELACVPGHWIPPILMTVFLLIANILLISMLIAIFNNIFDSTIKISQQIWLFQRYRQVMEYEATPFLPPPFTPIYHIYMIYKYLNYRNGYCCICFTFLTRQFNNRSVCQFFRRKKNVL
ncbi:hypothetical protein ACQ4LE_004186, partial [Meloidogyne hapla]